MRNTSLSQFKKNSNFVFNRFKFFNFKKLEKIKLKDLDKSDIKYININEFIVYNTAEDGILYRQNICDYIKYRYYITNKINSVFLTIDEGQFNKNFLFDLFEYLNPPEYSYIIEKSQEKELIITNLIIAFDKDLILYYDSQDLYFFINPLKHINQDNNNLFYNLLRLLNNYKTKNYQKNQINIVYKADYGFEKMSFDVKKLNINLNDNYNDGFKDVAENIIKKLNNKNTAGLYILDGMSGSGKTSFIRFLTGKLKRDIIFVSPDMVNYITDPGFIPFLMNNSDAVLIIEDAEPVLQKRDGRNRTSAISNILNLTDGLLSDCLNISIVATFNTSTSVLDDALLRKGRLITSYTFKKLTVEKSNKLLKKLGHDIEVNKEMSLADIYFYNSDNNVNIVKDKKIGF